MPIKCNYMKNLILSDDEAMYLIDPKKILEVGEVDGETRVAYVEVISVKQSVEEIRKQLTKKQAERIKWVNEEW